MDKIYYIALLFLLCLHLVIEIICIEHGSHYHAAVNFTAVVLSSGMATAWLFDNCGL